MDVTPTRAAGLERLAAFASKAGRHYAGRRNYDTGPEDTAEVSRLSPWICRRMVLEEEVIAAVLGAHSRSSAEKFVQEVFWRGYFKGWLEQRPAVWESYRAGLLDDRARLADASEWAEAEAGRTGIACFDAWAQQLVETGYLHNHARMWFASIWIFTLRLPWRLGADFFLRHLLDGDAASNTLSWRWVGGLHTVGKTYLARSANIAKYTEGRFPSTPGLVGSAVPLDEGGLPPRSPLRTLPPPQPVPSLYLLTTEDLSLAPLPSAEVAGLAALPLAADRSPGSINAAIDAFDHAAFADAATRFTAELHMVETADALIERAVAAGARQIVTGFLHQGWVRDWIEAARPGLDAAGFSVVEVQRDWDRAVHPHARAGYFNVKKKIPDILDTLAPDAEALPLFRRA
ncbi:MAG: FAD-binding domain-containing protein [Pseudomonadota bacterium]